MRILYNPSKYARQPGWQKDKCCPDSLFEKLKKDPNADNWFQCVPATSPTDAMPGSPEKVQVMIERAVRGEALWHPLDRAARLRSVTDDWLHYYEVEDPT